MVGLHVLFLKINLTFPLSLLLRTFLKSLTKILTPPFFFFLGGGWGGVGWVVHGGMRAEPSMHMHSDPPLNKVASYRPRPTKRPTGRT